MSAKTTCVSAAFMIFALVFGQAAAEVVRSDWSSFAPGSVVTIASGVTNLAEEADMEHVNRLSSIVFADATAAIRFTGETAPAVTFSGEGAIIKDSTFDWTLSKAAGSEFSGSYILKGGIVTPDVVSAFGKCDNSDSVVDIYVESGATLKFPEALKNKKFIDYSRLHLSGAGKDGKGALWVSVKQGTGQHDIRKIILEADATVFADGDLYYFTHVGSLKLNGHALTVSGNGDYYLLDCSVSGGGEIRLSSIDTGTRSLCIQGNWTRFPPSGGERTKIVLGNNCEIEYRESNKTKDNFYLQQYALKVEGKAYLRHGHQFYSSGGFPFGEYGDHKIEIDGPVELCEGANFNIRLQNAPHCQLKLTGQIAGPGNLLVTGDSQVYLANPANTFSGSLSYSGFWGDSTAKIGAVLRLGGTNSAPNYAAVTCDYGRVVLDVAADGSAWTTNAITRFMNEATFRNNAFVSLDASASEGKSFVFPGEWRSLVDDAGIPVASDGEGTLIVTGALFDRRYSFGSVDGTLKFTGDDAIAISNLFSAGTVTGHSQEVGNVVFDGAGNVNAENSLITIGNQWWNTANTASAMQYEETKGYMAVSNSTVNGNHAYSYPSVTGGGGIFPGWYGTGVLTIGEGAVITSNFMVAYGSDKACGAVYQHDGDVTFVASSKSEQRGYTGVVGYDGYGYYEMRKGRLKMLGRPCIGSSDSGCGILAIHGGETVIDRHFAESAADPWLILANKGVGHLYVSGGSLVSKSYIIVGYADNYSAYMTIGREGFVDCGIMIIGYAKSGRYFVNFNGGVFSCSSAQFRNDGRDNKVYYNFNGGTLKAKGSPFPEPSSDNNNQTFVTLYAGGMRFNSNGLNYELSCPVPIVEASGLGVVSVPLPEGLSDMDLAGSPFVEITGGGGSGAFAYAEFNSVARRVTGVRVICPGQNYTSPPTATFKMGSSVLGVSTCVLAENAPGGVEKLGEGTFVVKFPSDYRGDTIVSGGTLKAGCDWAISTNSAVVLKNGGVLDFNSKKGAVKALTYGAGGGLLKNAANVEIVSDFDIVLSADEVMGGAAASFGVKIDLDGKTLKVNGDLSAIAEGSARRYTLVSAPEITGEPVFECGELPKYWTLRVRNASVELVRARNFSLVVR